MTPGEPPRQRAVATLAAAADQAARAVPPAWPLASSVAVNPFLGQAHEDLALVGARLERVAGARVTMPRRWYQARIAGGVITDADLSDALARGSAAPRPASLSALRRAALASRPEISAAPTIADLAARVSGIDWPGLIAERFGAWAAGYFDEGQALWPAPRGGGAYDAWRAVATHDLTPEIFGLSGFAAFVSQIPARAPDALASVVHRLALPADAMETYFHQLLMTLGGWAHYARYRLWEAELRGGPDPTATDFLTIRLVWEAALFDRYRDQIDDPWTAVVASHAAPVTLTADHVVDAILQDAAERAAQRRLADTLARARIGRRRATGPLLQAVFCIDVRSEVYRRALESVNPDLQTPGFGGYFGLPLSHRRLASDVWEARSPVLLKAGLTTCSGGPEVTGQDQSARFKARAKRAWGRFKLAAVSSFAFVEAMGPIYAGKLVGDALGFGATPAPNDPEPRFHPDLDLATKIQTVETVLRAMSLTTRFARLVLLVGHGANVTNNPLASSLQCGACGGYSGEVNARLLAALLNDPEVRAGLAANGIEVPADTLFVPGLHDTTTDAVTLYAQDRSIQHACA